MTPPPDLTSRAVLFGVHAYLHQPDLQGVRHNAPALNDLLVAEDVGGLDPAHCVTVPPDSTAVDFLDAVQDAADQARDLLLVYYAGHGHFGRDGRRLLLSTRASRPARPFHSVPYDEVRAVVARSRARRKIVIVDSCFSGRALLHMGGGTGPSASAADFEIEGACVLTSAAETERSLCVPEGSVFTLELAAVLGSGLPAHLPGGRRGDQQPALTMADLYDALCARLADRTVEGHAVPKPRMSTRDSGHRIELAANRSFVAPAPALPSGPAVSPDRPGDVSAHRPRPALVPRTQFAPTPHFAGRAAELAELEAMAGLAPSLCLIHGRGGLGKSELLRAVAARVVDRFPDGCLEIDLRGWTPGETPQDPDAVITEQLLHLGTPSQRIPVDPGRRVTAWREHLKQRAVLLILDNARDAAQLAPLLPWAGSKSVVLVSSRSALPGLSWDWSRELSPLTADECVDAWHRMGVPESTDGLHEIADRVQGSPLAVRALSNRLRRGASPEAVLASLAGSSPYRAFPDIDAAERAAFTSAYDALDGELRTLVRHAAAHPGPDFGADSLAAMSGLPEHVAELRLTEVEQLLTHHDGRYGFHDLSLGYARERAAQDSPDEAQASRSLLYRHLLDGLERHEAAWQGSPDSDAPVHRARRWLRAHTQEMNSAARAAAAGGWADAPRFLRRLATYFVRGDRLGEARELFEVLRSVAEAGSPADAHALAGLGQVHRVRDHLDLSEGHYRRALDLYEKHDDLEGRATVTLELAWIAHVQDRFDAAVEGFESAHALFDVLGDTYGRANALRALGNVYVSQPRQRLEEAEDCFRRALALYRTGGNRRGQAYATLGIGNLLRIRGAYDRAAELFEEARTLSVSFGDQYGQAQALENLAWLYFDQDDLPRLTSAARSAQDLYEALDDRRGRASTLRCLAFGARAQEDLATALRLHEEAYRIHGEIGDLRGQANDLWSIAELRFKKQELSAASAAFEESLARWRELDDPHSTAGVLLDLASLAFHQRRYASATTYCHEALTHYQAAAHTSGLAHALSLMADITSQTSLPNTTEALDRREGAVDRGSRQASPAELYRTAAELYTKAGEEESARACLARLAELDS
ncbi:tetratricopeptide repeat protein [Streptomyces sp. NPDC017254]|uniref:caspase, EACC1-associated type n=1 Tax=unclassified Streptomyces TaxID=2593676 RepID=UPI0037A5598F